MLELEEEHSPNDHYYVWNEKDTVDLPETVAVVVAVVEEETVEDVEDVEDE